MGHAMGICKQCVACACLCSFGTWSLRTPFLFSRQSRGLLDFSRPSAWCDSRCRAKRVAAVAGRSPGAAKFNINMNMRGRLPLLAHPCMCRSPLGCARWRHARPPSCTGDRMCRTCTHGELLDTHLPRHVLSYVVAASGASGGRVVLVCTCLTQCCQANTSVPNPISSGCVHACADACVLPAGRPPQRAHAAVHACIVMVRRDLKPSNVLLDGAGRCACSAADGRFTAEQAAAESTPQLLHGATR